MATHDDRKKNMTSIQAKFSHLFKNSLTDIETILVSQWIPIAENLSVSELNNLNQYLLTRSYFVGQFVSLADIVIYNAIISLIKSDLSSLSKYENLLRWLSNISHLVNDGLHKTIPKQPTLIPTSFFTNLSTPVSSTNTVPVSAEGKNTSTDQKKSKEPSQPDTTIKPDTKKSKTIPTPATTSTSTEETSEDLDPSKLDIRVGTVIRCWNHPDSEKLLCEEIDIGEDTVRSIASGLRGHYTAEEVQGRKVLVLANLKERPMAGFKSQVYYKLVLLCNVL